MELKELSKVILFVHNMQATAAFYRDRLGLKVLYPEDVTDFSDERRVVFDTGGCQLTLRAGGRRRTGEDCPKLVFRVSDLRRVRQALLERGVKLGEIQPIEAGFSICTGQDPDGNRFSIEAKE